MKKLKAVKIIASGIVQGVGFRWAVAKKAREFKLGGKVRNQANGSVYIEVEGAELVIDEFIDFINQGPTPFAHVKNLQVTTATPQAYHTFYIE